MIRSFRNKALRNFALKGDPKGLSVPNVRRVRQILLALDSASEPDDMNQPGLRFHQLKGERRGTFAVDASGNFRITFRWEGSDAVDVDLEDYH
ncbi:type II toxin-antitoxin system RelE/ParE family toxin [Methylobacterium segetis]|uniref:type II toxin-antitoxin system RelE/ParE family toxin n=1 Tax=Methylobacterium segetis TaxID=2488750 RepID=UPI0010521D4F|nr:type II toxin-antitoxin system RelE/ParE family toxin [Methylobacterium segetis]